MDKEQKLLALCQSCINSLNTVINSGLPKATSLQLQQKIFLLETAIKDFSEVRQESSLYHETLSNDLPTNLKEASINFERNIIKNAIKLHGSKRKAAKALGIDHSTLIKKCQRYDI